jgi:hypothetical protein
MIDETRYLFKGYNDNGYRKTWNQAFTAFSKHVGFNNGLSAPQPDMIEGPGERFFKLFPVDDRLCGAAVLVKEVPNSITLPHLAGEWKGPGGDIIETRTWSAYDGTTLVYGRNQALEYLGDFDPRSHATATTFTTDGTSINSFAHYPAQSEEGGKIEYHQSPIASTNMTNSYEEFKMGRKQLRNLQDYAR